MTTAPHNHQQEQYPEGRSPISYGATSEGASEDAVSDDPQAFANLHPIHIDHLRAEGFTDPQILEWSRQGAQSLSEVEAEQREFKVWTKDGWKSGAGLYLPFTDSFGQLRLDEPIQRESGKIARYLTPLKAKSEAQLPDNCRVVTEGAKDAYAGLVHGGIPTGAIAGVSHYRKALNPGAGYTILFDSDGWTNPSVFLNLYQAGKYLDGAIQLIPEIPGEPKAGLCEYFKAGYTGEDYAALIESAMKPETLLMEWPEHFKRIPDTKLLSAIKIAFRLGAEYLDEAQLELLSLAIRKATKLSAKLLKDKLNEQRRIVKYKLKKVLPQISTESPRGDTQTSNHHLLVDPPKLRSESSHENQSAEPVQPELKDPNLVENDTVENVIFDNLFEKGTGRWATIDDTFYQDTGNGYWLRAPDKSVLKMIGLKCKAAYQLKKRKDESIQVFPFFTDSKKKSAFLICRDSLDLGGNLPANQHLRCFRNVTVDLRTGEALPHDKAHLLTTAIASDYEPNQPCPSVFLDFIKAAYGDDLIDQIRAYTSMLLDPTAPYGYFIHLMGPSGSGKGTLLRLWGEMFGLDNFRSGDFTNLSTAEGRHQYLTGTALFAVPDSGGYISGLKPFYELVDNGPMAGRALFSSTSYQKKWDVRFIVASVDHLQIENSGDGWDRRCRPLPTKTREGIEDPYLATKLAEVKGQIISWALAMSREERDRLIIHPSSNERVQMLKQDAALQGDPARGYIDLCLRPKTGTATLQSHELHSCFAAFAQAHGYQSWGMNKLINHLKTIIPDHYVPRQKKSGNLWIPAYWKNISFLPKVFVNASTFIGDGEQQQRQLQVEPLWKCIKSECIEGGLLAFKEFKSCGKGWTHKACGYPISAKGTPGTPGTPPSPAGGVPPETYIKQALQDTGTPGTPGTPPFFRFLKKIDLKNANIDDNSSHGTTALNTTRPIAPEISAAVGVCSLNNAPESLNKATVKQENGGQRGCEKNKSNFSKNPSEGGVPGVPAVPCSENLYGVTITAGTPLAGEVTVPAVPGVPFAEIGYPYASSVHTAANRDGDSDGDDDDPDGGGSGNQPVATTPTPGDDGGELCNSQESTLQNTTGTTTESPTTQHGGMAATLPQGVEWLDATAPEWGEQRDYLTSARRVSLDIETFQPEDPGKKKPNGLHPWRSRVRLIQFSTNDRTFIADMGGRGSDWWERAGVDKPIVQLIRQIIQNPDTQVIGQNLIFDLRFLATQYGIRHATNIWDTMIGAQVYFGDYGRVVEVAKKDSGEDDDDDSEEKDKKEGYQPILFGGYPLANLAHRFLNVEMDKTEQLSDWGTVLTSEQLTYAARDAKIVLKVYDALEALYKDETQALYFQNLRECWQLENDVIPCAIEIELAGMPLDKARTQAQLDVVSAHIKRLKAEWFKLCPDIKPTQGEKLKVYLKEKYQLDVLSLAKDKLSPDERKNPLIQLRAKLDGLTQHARPLKGFLMSSERDNRVHTIYRTLSGSGRFSSGGGKATPNRNEKDLPNLQSIKVKLNPSLKEFYLPPVREVIRPDNGRTMAVIDLSGAHGRIAASETKDPTAIAGNNDPSIDNHLKVAEFIARAQGLNWTAEYMATVRKDKSHPDSAKATLFRDTAKNTYYGWLNGAGAKRIQQQINGNTGIMPHLDACKAAIKGCKALYPGVLKHRDALMERLCETALEIDGRLCSINTITGGFRICLPLEPTYLNPNRLQAAFTKNLAALWSRIEAVAVKKALIQVMQLRTQHPEWNLDVINYVHDEIDIEVDTQFASVAVPQVNNIIGDCFAALLDGVSDGREPNWEKLVVESWADK